MSREIATESPVTDEDLNPYATLETFFQYEQIAQRSYIEGQYEPNPLNRFLEKNLESIREGLGSSLRNYLTDENGRLDWLSESEKRILGISKG